MHKLEFGLVLNEEIRFIPMDDDVIAYDEFVLERVWKMLSARCASQFVGNLSRMRAS